MQYAVCETFILSDISRPRDSQISKLITIQVLAFAMDVKQDNIGLRKFGNLIEKAGNCEGCSTSCTAHDDGMTLKQAVAVQQCPRIFVQSIPTKVKLRPIAGNL